MNSMTIMLYSTVNINSAVFNALVDGGNSTKTVHTAEKRLLLSSQQMDKKSNSMRSHRSLHKMTKILFQDVFNAGLILMKTSKRKLVTLVVPTLFTRDV